MNLERKWIVSFLGTNLSLMDRSEPRKFFPGLRDSDCD